MLPFAIPGIASLADTALKTWNRIADSHAASKAQPTVDFVSLLDKAASAGASAALQGANAGAVANTQSIQSQLAGLPEVKSALSAAVPGTQVNFSLSPNGDLFQMLPGGSKQQLSLSAESQALLRQCTAGNSMALTLLA